ncbi:MAG: 50S ribosomal protein L13 [Patescibacteria group bacterium]|nr:50S ribosomal protein L13 [Patescibacteria group bacterium]
MIKIERKIHKLDAKGQAVGRLASQIALILRGKNKVDYTPYLDMGDIVQVDNIDKFKFSGKKIEQKKYHSYSGYPGGLKTRKMKNIKPSQILIKAVKDMLPKNSHRVNMLKRIIINSGENK